MAGRALRICSRTCFRTSVRLTSLVVTRAGGRLRVGGAVGDYGASGGGDGGSVLGAGSLGVLVGRSGGGGWRKVPFGALRLLLGRLSLGGFRRVRSTDACRKRTRGHGIRQNPHPVAKSATRVGHPQFFRVVG